jgi:ElaB/YqjD/DUF883 family membrane-anchored ribosome-binding protein
MKTTQAEVPNDGLIKEFESVVTEAEHLIRSIAEASSDKALGMRASVEQGLADTRERLAKIRAQVVDQASGAVRATGEYVQDNPWQAIGVAAGVAAVAGLVAGLAIARR